MHKNIYDTKECLQELISVAATLRYTVQAMKHFDMTKTADILAEASENVLRVAASLQLMHQEATEADHHARAIRSNMSTK